MGVIIATLLNCASSFDLPNENEIASKLTLPTLELPPIDNDEDEPLAPWAEAMAESTATVTILYGTSLLLYGSRCSEQLLILTLMRATGYSKIEKALETSRKNFRRALRSAVWHAPSFLKAAHTVRHIHDRIDEVKNSLEESKKAKEDGVITPKEEWHLKRLHKRQLALLRRDMRRLQRASVNLGKFIADLNVVEVLDILRALLFHLLAVIPAAHSKSRVGVMVSEWCYFINLGTLLYDVLRKVMLPIAEQSSRKVDKGILKTFWKIAVAGATAYLIDRHKDFAYRLNSALLEAAIIVHGLKYFVTARWDGDEDTRLATVMKLLQNTGGGLLMLLLSALSLHFHHLNDQNKMTTPEFILKPLMSMETGIQVFVEHLCVKQSSDTARGTTKVHAPADATPIVHKVPVPADATAEGHKVPIPLDATSKVQKVPVRADATAKVQKVPVPADATKKAQVQARAVHVHLEADSAVRVDLKPE